MNNHYVQGFIQKCAEAGVDPEELAKLAQSTDSRLWDSPPMKWLQGVFGGGKAPQGKIAKIKAAVMELIGKITGE